MVGGEVLTGAADAAWTTVLGLDEAVDEPYEFVPVTDTRSVLLTSELVTA
jgi:hypothetical protein